MKNSGHVEKCCTNFLLGRFYIANKHNDFKQIPKARFIKNS